MTVSRAAFALGFAGLLPPLAGVALVLLGEGDAALIVLAYALMILSFLGGMWWGFAMRRVPERQLPLLLAAVIPSLLAATILWLAGLTARWDMALVATGICLALTLPVDRWLAAAGDAPASWMRLRIPLSLGLGSLCILAGWLSAR